MKVFRSHLIDAAPDKVWRALRAFDSIQDWHPACTGARIEKGRADAPGAVRHLDIADGSHFKETLEALSDSDMSLTYSIIEGPLPVRSYLSTMRLIPVTTSGQTLAVWECSFDCAEDVQADMDKVVGGMIYVGGLKGLAAHVTG